MKQIDISTPRHPNTFALVDDSDFENLNKHKWYASTDRCDLTYAQRGCFVGGRWRILKMHNAILGRVSGKMTDHRNGITLDNQRHNLRHCTNAENSRNRKLHKNNTSGYKGVSWRKKENKWYTNITVNRKNLHIGGFSCLVKAAKAYDEAARKHFGDFAWLNFPCN